MSGLSFHWQKSGKREDDTCPLLHVKELSVKVGFREVLSVIEMEVYPGDHVRVTGPNGSGKSTLFNAIAGIDPARVVSGQVIFNGLDITDLPPHERAALGITYMGQTDNVFLNLSVAENLKLALGINGYGQFSKAFPEWVKELPENKRAGQLSGGQKKKLAWAMSLLSDKKLFLADEPFSGVAHPFEVPTDERTYLMITHE